MRIIAGNLKGRQLYTPADRRIRPTSDKVKEALFNMAAFYLEDAVVVDLFSGTGNLGIEAISRGAKRTYFCDKSRSSITLICKNIEHCGVSEKAVLLQGDFEKTLDKIPEAADLILLDPPYKKGLLHKCLEKIQQLELLREDGIIIAEHGSDQELEDSIFNFVKEKEKKYGTIVLSLYKHKNE